MKKFKRTTILLTVITLAIGTTTGCASWSRSITDVRSNLGGGLQRTVNVYTADGDVLAEYKGKIDIETSEGGYVKFDLNGKRYIYYNCFVETIADIN